METVEIHATKDQVEELRDSIVWKDLVTELESWKEGFNSEMLGIVDDAAAHNPSSASVLLHMGDLNGRMKAVDYMIGLPDMFLQILENRKKKE